MAKLAQRNRANTENLPFFGPNPPPKTALFRSVFSGRLCVTCNLCVCKMSKLTCVFTRFLSDRRGSVQPEVIALTVSAMLLGVTYLETQQQQEANPAVKEEVYVRKCGTSVPVSGNAGLAALRERTACG